MAPSRTIASKRRSEDYLDLPLERHGHRALLPRIVDLRANLPAYDPAYVALAENLGAEFVTGDERLAQAARSHTFLAIHDLARS